jgi:drug/metabolite transporter (DMT)-like permease
MWILLCLSAAFCFTGLFLLMKFLQNSGVDSACILLWIFALGTGWNALFVGITAQSVAVSGRVFFIFFCASILSYLGNIAQTRAIALAPNPGYAIALISSQALLTTLLGAFFFGSEFSFMKGVGIGITLIGIALVSL